MSLILPKVEKISWRCSRFTFLVRRPMWILVGGGEPLRARVLAPDRDLERCFSGAALTLGLSSFTLLSFLAGEDPGSFPALALALSLPPFFLSFFDLSLLLDLLESELESLLDSELESLLELLLELESLFFLLRASFCFFFPLPLSGLESLLSSRFFSFSLLPPFSFSLPFVTAIFLR